MGTAGAKGARAADSLSVDLYDQPGHLIRRAHQRSVAAFAEALGRDVTPVQYAVLRMLQERPGIDQVTLAREVALDNSTTADIAARLESKGWIVREVLPRRQRRLLLTEEGAAVLARLVPGIHRLQATLLTSLEPAERDEFLRLLRKFAAVGDGSSASSNPG